MLKKWNDMMRCAFVRSFASFCSSNVLHARSHAKRFVYLFVMLLFRFVFPFFPFLSNNCPCIWIVFTWLFGEPSCGETTLLNSPSEQTNVSYYIRIYKRYIQLHASLYDCVYGMVDVYECWCLFACIWIDIAVVVVVVVVVASLDLMARKGQFQQNFKRGCKRRLSYTHQIACPYVRFGVSLSFSVVFDIK